MTHPHPASVILLGLAILLAGSSRDGVTLFIVGLALTITAMIAATPQFSVLLRRSRWLLLTMLVMFGWLTPGTALTNVPGASQEGLLLASESIARLFIALSTVAVLLKALPPPELVTGMRALLAPLALLGIPRDSIAVRLALTLQEVENSRSQIFRGEERILGSLGLPTMAPGVTDAAMGIVAAALVCAAALFK